MPQGNVISASRSPSLRPLSLLCSLSLPAAVTSAAEPQIRRVQIRQTMDRSEKARSESDVRRSALMAAGQAGDRVAYETLLRDCVPFVAGIARRQGVPPASIDDVVQEALLTLHRARATYDPRRSFEAWLRVIVERRAIDMLRQLRRRGAREVHAPIAYESHADEAADAPARMEQQDKIGRVGAALSGLTERQREAVDHLMVEERTLAEAALLTGRSKGSLKVNLHRALHALRLRLARGD